MDKYIAIIGTLSGTIIGFLLSLLKDYFQNKSKVIVVLKSGEFNYYKEYQDLYGDTHQDEIEINHANLIKSNFMIDISNIGKISTGISEIMICIQANKRKMYFSPQISYPFENKNLTNVAFNLDANNIITLNASVEVRREEDTEFLFNDITIDLASKNRLLFIVILRTIKKQEIKMIVEPLGIFTFY